MTRAVVVGAGHNGLIAAAYLARAGLSVTVLEAGDATGGCAATVSALGARFNICNCDHILVRSTPIIDELRLADHGLTYLPADPVHLHLGWDGAAPWPLFQDAERTIDGLGRLYPASVPGYRRYLAAARPAADLTIEMANVLPTAPTAARAALRRRMAGVRELLAWSRMSAESVMRSFFPDEEVVRALMTTGPSVWGVTPRMPGTGLAALAFAMKHRVGAGRPVGGSGAFPDSVRSALEAAGGSVRCGARVAGLRADRSGVRAVVLDGGEQIDADLVVTACDPRTVLVDWIGPAAPPRAARRWAKRPRFDGYESKIDAVLSTLPRYRSLTGVSSELLGGIEPLTSTGVISPTVAEADAAWAASNSGRIADRPPLLANYPSVVDETLRSDGRHILSLEALHTPYALEGGWQGSAEPQRWLERYAELLEPGFLDSIVDYRVMTPVDYESQFGMDRGFAPAFSGSPLQAVLGRDRELTRYRTPVRGVYVSGAGTYPGAGVWGAAGRNAASVVLRDLGVAWPA